MKNTLIKENDFGIFNAKEAWLNGKLYTFTHFDPKTNKVWSEEIGEWVDKENVKWTI